MVCGVCVGLCCLRALRGLWGFCTRVELGGFRAYCVFASIFIVLPLFFFFFACFPALLVLFAGLVYLCCFCGSLCFLFPYRTIRKKKGRKGFAPCVLSWCVVGVFACRSYSVALDACFSVIIPHSSA